MSRLMLSAVVCALFASPAIAQEWQELKPAGAAFRAMLPGEAKYTTRSFDTPIGKMHLHTYMVETESGATGLLYSDFPADHIENSDVETLLTDARDSAVGDGELTSDKEIAIGDHPGREFTFAARQDGETSYTGWQRVILVGNRIYQQIVVTAGDKTAPEADLEKLRTSFELIGE